MDYIQITKENIDKEHICCAMSGKQSLAKKEWLKQRFAEGLVFYRSVERGKCFIEYIPAENAWVPIDADGYLYINCLWVSGSLKGHGYSSELLEECLRDAKAQGKISDSFKRFADIHLSRHAAELKSVFCQPLGDRYRDQLPRLTRDIDSILLLAGYYDPVVAQAWLENWQGLHHAIATGQRIEIEHFRNEANNQEPFWLHSGKR